MLVGSVFATEPIALDPEDLVRRCVTLRGVHNYAPDDLRRAVTFLKDRASRFPFADLVGAEYSLEEIDVAIEVAAQGGYVRVGIRPRATTV